MPEKANNVITRQRQRDCSAVQDRPVVSPYIAPKELAARWRCSRSTVDRIARRECFTRVCLGTGNNGMVRYLRKEVIAYEQSRQISLQS